MAEETTAAQRSNRQKVILKFAEETQASLTRSSNENEIRANIRENVEKLGIDSKAFQVAVRMAKGMTPGERQDYQTSITDTLEAIDGHESDLFGAAEIAARDKRAQKRADKAAGKPTPPSKADAKSDKAKRSDPKSGGAGKKGKDKPAAADTAPGQDEVIVDDGEGPPGETGDEMIKRVSAKKNAEREQREGGAVLDQKIADVKAAAGDVDKVGENGIPKSQSQIAAEKRNALGLN